MNKKQKLVMALLMISIIFSLISIGFGMSLSSSEDVKFIKNSPEVPVSNIGITIDSPEGSVYGENYNYNEGFENGN